MGRILIYTTSGCYHCLRARKILDQKNLKYTEINLAYHQDKIDHVFRTTGRKSVPIILLNKEVLGGLDALQALELSPTGEKRIKEALDENFTPPDNEIWPDPPEELKYDDERIDEVYYRLRDPREGIRLKSSLMKDKYFKASDLPAWIGKTMHASEPDALKTCQLLREKGFIARLKGGESSSLFTADSTAYRFQEDTDPFSLNIRRILDLRTPPISPLVHNPVDLSIELHQRILTIVQKQGMDYGNAIKTVAFRKFQYLTLLLQQVNLTSLDELDLLAFFLNVYHTLLLHGMIAFGASKRTAFMKATYLIQGCKFTLSDIENGILRANRKPNAVAGGDAARRWEKTDERVRFVPNNFDPRVLFAISSATRCTPAYQLYSRATLDDALQYAVEVFCNEEVEVDVEKKSVSLSSFFQLYGPDLGRSRFEVLAYLDKYLNEDKHILLMHLLKTVPSAELAVHYSTAPFQTYHRYAAVFEEAEPQMLSFKEALAISGSSSSSFSYSSGTSTTSSMNSVSVSESNRRTPAPAGNVPASTSSTLGASAHDDSDSSLSSLSSHEGTPRSADEKVRIDITKTDQPAAGREGLKDSNSARNGSGSAHAQTADPKQAQPQPPASTAAPAQPTAAPAKKPAAVPPLPESPPPSNPALSSVRDMKARSVRYAWEIDMSQVEVGDKIGQGGFGVVYKGTWAGTEVAIKQLISDELSEQQLNDFLKEISIMSQLRHPNVVLFVGACLNPPNVFYLTEFLAQGSLHTCLRQGPLALTLRLKMALDAAKGMHYLHSRTPPMLHRDIKSLNFLVDEHYTVKVADFGLSKALPESRQNMNTRVGTLNWLAPETLADHGVYTIKSDVFSFGMVLWEILTQKTPYEGKNPIHVVRSIDAGVRPEMPPNTDPEFAQLIKDCWAQAPADRPTFDIILSRLKKIYDRVLAEEKKK